MQHRPHKIQGDGAPPPDLYDQHFGAPHIEEQRRLAFARGYRLAYDRPAYASDVIAGILAGRRDRQERTSAEVSR